MSETPENPYATPSEDQPPQPGTPQQPMQPLAPLDPQAPQAPPPPYGVPAPPPPPPYGAPGAAPPPPYGAPPAYGAMPPPYGAPAPYGAPHPPGWGPPPPVAGYPGYGYPQQPTTTNAFAIASLACSIVLSWLFGLGGILAVVFGTIALRTIAQNGERGRGLAIAGIIIGSIAIVFWLIVLIVGIATGFDTSSSSGSTLGA